MHSRNNKTIAITGATGFLGSHLMRSLSSDGYRIISFGRVEKPPAEIYKYSEYIPWDITMRIAEIKKFSEVFIHTASYVKFWGDRQEIYDANVVGTINAIDTAKKMHAKTFIYISSASVYDPFSDKINATESAHYAKRYLNYYAETKVQAEKAVLNAKCFDSIIILRPHVIYGPGDRTIVPNIIKHIRHGRFILPGSGKSKYSVTHVGNIIDSVRLIINNAPTGKHVFNITDVEQLSAKEFISKVLNLYDKKIKITEVPFLVGIIVAAIAELPSKIKVSKNEPIVTKDLVLQLRHESTMSIDNAMAVIGYRPRYRLEEGLSDTFNWIKSTKSFDPKDYINSSISLKGKIPIY